MRTSLHCPRIETRRTSAPSHVTAYRGDESLPQHLASQLGLSEEDLVERFEVWLQELFHGEFA